MHQTFTRGGQRPRALPDANRQTGPDSPEKIQNRPQLSSFVADLLVNDLPHAAKDLGAPDSTASQRVLVPIPTQWRRRVSRGFDHTWLMAQAIRTRHAEPMVVRSWLRNQRFRPP